MAVRIPEICKKFPNVNIIMSLERQAGDALQLSREPYYIVLIIEYKDKIRLLGSRFYISSELQIKNELKLNNSVVKYIKLFIAEIDKQ